MNDNFGLLWASSTSPTPTTSTLSYSWYTPTTSALPAVCGTYSPTVTASTVSTPGLGIEGRSRSKSPLSNLGVDFREGMIIGNKKFNRDGQPTKRRGPKPDRQPAMTRRQELNRLAQRTHRLKKETQMKALERQNVHLKQLYSEIVEERDAILEENRNLRAILQSKGIFPRNLNSVRNMEDSTGTLASQSSNYASSVPLMAPGSDSSSLLGVVPSIHGRMYYSEAAMNPHDQPRILSQDQLQQHSNMLNYDPLASGYLLGSTPQGSTRSLTSQAHSYHSPNSQNSP